MTEDLMGAFWADWCMQPSGVYVIRHRRTGQFLDCDGPGNICGVPIFKTEVDAEEFIYSLADPSIGGGSPILLREDCRIWGSSDPQWALAVLARVSIAGYSHVTVDIPLNYALEHDEIPASAFHPIDSFIRDFKRENGLEDSMQANP